jgi:sirohydrochlorin cobaltochelatase
LKTVIVLAMHGAPPTEASRSMVAELVGLHQARERAPAFVRAALERRYRNLDAKMRAWPRTRQNDPFWAGSQDLAKQLRTAAGLDVIVGFNEFCAPALEDALDQAAAQGDNVIVITPMLTRGGEHSEVDIPTAVKSAQERHPSVTFKYAWPLDISEIASFLAAQIARLV